MKKDKVYVLINKYLIRQLKYKNGDGKNKVKINNTMINKKLY